MHLLTAVVASCTAHCTSNKHITVTFQFSEDTTSGQKQFYWLINKTKKLSEGRTANDRD